MDDRLLPDSPARRLHLLPGGSGPGDGTQAPGAFPVPRDRRRRVLLAGGDPLLARLLAQTLPDVLRLVAHARVPAEVHDVLARFPAPELVLVDLRSPGMAGLAGELLPRHPALPVFVLAEAGEPPPVPGCRLFHRPLELARLRRAIRACDVPLACVPADVACVTEDG